MECKSYLQFAIVQGDSAQDLTDRLNRTLRELPDKSPTVTFEGMTARICYTEVEKIFDEPEDAIEAMGLKITCVDCPFFEPFRNKDGSVSGVHKRGKCEFARFGKTYRDSKACLHLIECINRGEVKLCLAE